MNTRSANSIAKVVVHEENQDNMWCDWIDQVVISRTFKGVFTLKARKNKQNSRNPSQRGWETLMRVPGIKTAPELVRVLQEAEVHMGIDLNWMTVIREVSVLDWAMADAIAFSKNLPSPLNALDKK